MSYRAEQEKYDNIFLSVLQQEGSLPGLFDSLFSFLMRRTDFYLLLRDSEKGDRGFPEGAALGMVTQSFKKHEAVARRAIQQARQHQQPPQPQKQQQQQQHQAKTSTLPSATQQRQKQKQQDLQPTSSSTVIDKATGEISYQADPECYNGAARQGYSWSQSIAELDIRVSVEGRDAVKKGSDVRVRVGRRSVLVECRQATGSDSFVSVLDRQLCHEVRSDEAVWSLLPSDSIVHISLEKIQERWWDACFEGEEKINTREIDCSRPMTDLDEEAQAKIDQMMFDQRQKQLGLPTSEEARNLEVLRKAWNAPGSPFKGTPFDPSVLGASGQMRPPEVTDDKLDGAD